MYYTENPATAFHFITLGFGLGILSVFLLVASISRKGGKNVTRYADVLEKDLRTLSQTSARVDQLILELNAVASDRAAAVHLLEKDLADLHNREKDLRQTIADLRDVPLPVADRFRALLGPSERRNALRDYALFGAGVVASAAVAAILQVTL